MATGKAIIATVKIDDYIKEHYPTTHAKVIAEALGLQTKWVQNRAWLLNVTKNRVKAKEIAQEEAKLANENVLLNTTNKTMPVIKTAKRKVMQALLKV